MTEFLQTQENWLKTAIGGMPLNGFIIYEDYLLFQVCSPFPRAISTPMQRLNNSVLSNSRA